MWHSWVYSHWDHTGSVPGEVGSESYTDLVYIIIQLNINLSPWPPGQRLTSHLSWTRACILRESTYVAVPHRDFRCCSVHGSVTINAQAESVDPHTLLTASATSTIPNLRAWRPDYMKTELGWSCSTAAPLITWLSKDMVKIDLPTPPTRKMRDPQCHFFQNLWSPRLTSIQKW